MKKTFIFVLSCMLLFSCGDKKMWQVDFDNVNSISEEENNQQEIEDSITRELHIDAVKHSIKILKATITSSNSVGGHDAIFHFKNVSNKTIKYLTWTAGFENAVGDLVENEVGGYKNYAGKYTGPLAPGKSVRSGCWENVIYNYSAKKMKLQKVEIIYMDGTDITISEDELDYLY